MAESKRTCQVDALESKAAIKLITKNGLQVLRKTLGLTPDSDEKTPQDVLFVAMDFERIRNIKYGVKDTIRSTAGTKTLDNEDQETLDKIGLDSEDLDDLNDEDLDNLEDGHLDDDDLDNDDDDDDSNIYCRPPDEDSDESEVGIAILDTRDLASPPENAISTFSLVTGSDRYYKSRAEMFLFGRPSTIQYHNMLSTLNSLIPRARDIILVGHDIHHELRLLRRLGFDLQTSIVGIIDTQKLFSEKLQEPLWHILQELGCPFALLHSGGNDAHFTLKALLLLGLRDYDESVINASANLSRIEEIARLPLPPLSHDQEWKAWDQRNLDIAWQAQERTARLDWLKTRRRMVPEIMYRTANHNSKLSKIRRKRIEMRGAAAREAKAAWRLIADTDIDLSLEAGFLEENEKETR